MPPELQRREPKWQSGWQQHRLMERVVSTLTITRLNSKEESDKVTLFSSACLAVFAFQLNDSFMEQIKIASGVKQEEKEHTCRPTRDSSSKSSFLEIVVWYVVEQGS